MKIPIAIPPGAFYNDRIAPAWLWVGDIHNRAAGSRHNFLMFVSYNIDGVMSAIVSITSVRIKVIAKR